MPYKKDFLADKSDEALLAEIKRVASITGKSQCTREDFRKHARVSASAIKNRFGSWNHAIELAGLKPSIRKNIDNTEIFVEIRRLWDRLGRRPSTDEFDKLAKFSTALLKKRFGSFLGAMDAFIHENEIGQTDHGPDKRDEVDISETAAIVQPATKTPTRARVRYGSLINFRGMLHAPMNELGVVFLFGMLAKELGFIVEGISASFPDCEAKRLDESGKYWERVAIEFEFLSSSFRQHGHDSSRCDLIVCWSHDWIECPVPVLELSRIIHNGVV